MRSPKPLFLRSSRSLQSWLPVFVSLGSLTIQALHAAPSPEQLDFFEQKIRPVLSDKCYSCHSSDAKSVKAGLLLDSLDGWIKGGESGTALVIGSPEKSMAIKAIHYADDEMLMPPKKSGGKLPDNVIADFEKWIKDGAAWPEEKKTAKKVPKFDLAERKQSHWCWQNPVASVRPADPNDTWSASDIDRFIFAELRHHSLKPAPPADPVVWLRRVTFDLTGLPPSPDEVAAFTSDSSPNAMEKVVDRLLASEHYGERWARHWMDLVRYAESRGHEFDPPIPNAWQYRDYLVRAFNKDIPYTQFVKEHIAGDLLPPRINPATGANDSVLGTGFWFFGEEVHSPVDIRQDEADRMDNRLDTMTKAFLGVTVGCARCHDHKFDAISQKDYYALTGFLVSSGNRQVRFETLETERRIAHELENHKLAAQPELLKALAIAEQAEIKQSKAYLLAARDCFLADNKGEKSDPAPDAITALAAQQKLDSKQLSAWIDQLKEARTNPKHVLHLFATTAMTQASSDSSQLTGRVNEAVERLTKTVPNDLTSEGVRVVADYTNPATPLIQDGFAFGLHPAKTGDILLGNTPENPITEVITQTAARREALWKNIVNKGESEPGTLKEYNRAGQTLRTPEFTITNGPLWYLVRGAGRAYAVVDSHVMIQGPLHGKLLTKWKGNGSWEWFAHNLADYKGHRAHIELIPDGQSDLEVAMVVESQEKPRYVPQNLPLTLADFLSDAAVSVESLAQAVQDGLQKTSSKMLNNRLSDEYALAPWADWMARNLDLLCPPASQDRITLKATAVNWITKQNAITAQFPRESQTATAMFEGSGVDEFLLRRGSTRSPQAPVPRRFLEALAGNQPLKITTGSGRLELADAIVDPKNPLTSRVIVNRVWQHVFGRGIVPTVDNFGVLGQAPSHPALLDYLAIRFANDQHWSLKTLLKELVLTSTYRMSSSPSDATAETADPQNRLLHRMNLKRLEGEAIRDSILAVSGRLNPKIGGASIPIFITPFMEGRGRPSSGPLDGDGRRSLYIAIKRNFLSPMMLAFDMPIPFQAMGCRNVSNVPVQSLVLMNDPFVVAQAGLWAQSLSPSLSPEERIKTMYIKAFAREPLASETADAIQFLKDQSGSHSTVPSDPKVWADLCHILFNTKEFIHLN